MGDSKEKPSKLKILTAEEIADTSRYEFVEEPLDLHEIGGAVMVRTLEVGARRAIPSMRDENGVYSPTKEGMAASFAAIVSQPKLTPEEAAVFIDKLPVTAYDRVQLKFAEMVGSEEERRATEREFRPSEDGSEV